ncbi:pilus assembly protein TadG-related protein [Massilia sp.]|uniref:pilus assembly protein TadG-related protein n=1 Tax=Massilia sp. TaxID=1882437 RepID=UPI0028AD5E1B|nr:pilus assembly protein TadG-related protein [Massilia sp.]
MRFNHSRNRGQTLVLFLGFVAAMVGMMLVVFNSGQVTNAKMRAMNAADAAAYSGAVWEARSLNFQAYMNRAMVVNEVTIAQSVSLRSWISYVARFVANVNMITQFIPWVGTVTTEIKQVLNQVSTSMNNLLPMADMALRGVNLAAHSAQHGFYASGSIIAQELATEVAKANKARMSPAGVELMASNTANWIAFTRPYEGKDRARIKAVTLDSRDGFSQNRDNTALALSPAFEVAKQGGTDLIDYDSWKALDSSELRTLKIAGKWTSKTPLAWGGAQSYAPTRKTGIGKHGEENKWNRSDGQRARTEANAMTPSFFARANAKSIAIPFQGYYDISNPKDKKADLQLPFSVEVVVPKADIPTGTSALHGKAALADGTQIEHDPNYAGGGGVYALAEACVRFARPYREDRADKAREFPSLFNPYWTASLATESPLARAWVDGRKGLIPPISTVFTKDTCS